MTDRFDDLDLPEDELDALSGLLSNDAIWGDSGGDVNSTTEDAIVAAIAAERAEASSSDRSPAEPAIDLRSDDAELRDNVISIDRFRQRIGTFVAGAAAAALLIAGIFGITQLAGNSDGVQLALEATDNAPDASASAVITDTPQGTKIVLDVDDLPPAAPGTYYEAWLRIDAETGVSAGTFHLRGGDAEIELWAGVTTDEFPLFTITIQDEAQPESSGVVVLRGLVESGE